MYVHSDTTGWSQSTFDRNLDYSQKHYSRHKISRILARIGIICGRGRQVTLYRIVTQCAGDGRRDQKLGGPKCLKTIKIFPQQPDAFCKPALFSGCFQRQSVNKSANMCFHSQSSCKILVCCLKFKQDVGRIVELGFRGLCRRVCFCLPRKARRPYKNRISEKAWAA